MELKGSRTEQNLVAAFAGESQARNKYTYFAEAAKKEGFYAVDFAFGPEEAMGAAMLVNTAPAPVITRSIIRELPRDAYILDIASAPGGTDFECAKEYGIRADLSLGLPGKYAPKESAYILDRAIDRFVSREEGV